MFRTYTLLSLALLLPPTTAQAPATARAPGDAAAFARAYLEMVAPQRDDPDANAAASLQALDAHRTRGYASHLARLVRDAMNNVQRPGALLPAVDALLAHDDLHGELRNSLGWLRFRIQCALGEPAAAAAADPARAYPRQFVAVGPFGEGEDHFAGAPFAPELGAWTLDATFSTPTRTLRPRAVRLGAGISTVDARDPSRAAQGCYYLLHRVEADQPTQCYLDLWCRGGVEVFVNGARVSSTDPSLDDGRTDRMIPIGLAAGVNHVLLKTCAAQSAQVELRYIDARADVVGGLREVAADAPIGAHATPLAATLPPLTRGVDVLMQQLARAEGVDADGLRIAAGLIADSRGLREAPLELVDDLEPTDPTQQLALAQLWRQLQLVPEEMRNSRARALEEAAGRQLDGAHFAMLRASVGLLEQQDQREQALRALWTAVDEGRAGPETFGLLLRVARGANFSQERPRILARWRAALPNDPTPCIELVRDWHRAGATARAAELGAAAIRMRPDIGDNLGVAYRPSVDLGDLATARELVALTMPIELYDNATRVRPLLWEAAVAFRDADEGAWRAAVDAIVAHRDADADDLRRAGDTLLARGHADAAARAYDGVLAREPDDIRARRSARHARSEAEPGAGLERFWRDGDAAIAAFEEQEREASAPATALIDQRIVEVFDDGSLLLQVHELRRLNDPTGVEYFSDPSALGEADEVMLLRTIDGAGEQYVPVRLQDSYSMPRLEPGAFVEWRYQVHYGSSEDGAIRVPDFLFRSPAEHKLLAEFVVVRPKGSRLQLRSRNLTQEPERIDLDDGREALRYRIEDSLRLLPENAMPSLAALVPVIAGGQDGSAAFALRQHAHVTANVTRPSPPIREQVAELLAGVDDPGEQLRALDAFCQQEIARARSRSATETLLRRRGDRNQLLLAMLQTADFRLEPARCESIRADMFEGDGALFRDPAMLYDMGCVRVSKEGLAPLWLFPDAPRYFPPGRVPPQRARAGVLVHTDDGVELTQLPATDEHAQTMRIVATGTLSAERLEVEATLTLGGDDGFRAAEHFLQQPRQAQLQFARNFSQQMFQGWQLQSAYVSTLEAGAQVAVTADLRRRALQRDGDRELLAMPLPPGGFLGAFGARPDRDVPMRHTTDLELRYDLRLRLDGVRVTELPATVTIEFGPLTYLQQVRLDGDELVVRRRAIMHPARVETAQFADWMQALQRVERAENLNIACRVE